MFNGLTEKQMELLFILSEEAGEIVQAVGKMLRHGANSYHPENEGGSNLEELSKELGQLRAVVHLLCKEGLVDIWHHDEASGDKLESILKKQYTHHQ